MTLRGRSAAVLIGIAVLLCSGCTAATVDSTPSPSLSAVADHAEIGCNVIATAAPAKGDLVVAGAIAFGAAASPLTSSPDSDRKGWDFAKAGLAVDAGHTWSITVPRSATRHLVLGWGSPPVFARTVDPPRECGATTGWSTFPGGFQVNRPGCYPVDVRVDGSTSRVHIAVDTDCPS